MAATAAEAPDTAKGLSPAEAAARLGVAECTIRRWIKSGRLPAKRLLPVNRLMIGADDLDRVITLQTA